MFFDFLAMKLTRHIQTERRRHWDALVVVDGLAGVDGPGVLLGDGGHPQRVGGLTV